jgi:hypothetical protein
MQIAFCRRLVLSALHLVHNWLTGPHLGSISAHRQLSWARTAVCPLVDCPSQALQFGLHTLGPISRHYIRRTLILPSWKLIAFNRRTRVWRRESQDILASTERLDEDANLARCCHVAQLVFGWGDEQDSSLSNSTRKMPCNWDCCERRTTCEVTNP